MAEQKKVNGNTKLGADLAFRRKAISEESHAAILAGEMSLQEAKDRGPDTPPRPVSRISKDDRTPTKTPCVCGCGELVPRRFAPGHDARMSRVAREHLTEGRELSGEQREYLETSGKMGRVKAKLAEEAAKRRGK